MAKSSTKLKKCDIFTPDKIGIQMASFLTQKGSFLEPAVGTGSLLKHINYNNYTKIDICDIEKEYLDQIQNNSQLNKIHFDFLKYEFKNKYNNIIMNPPYIRFQQLDPEYRKFIQDKYPILNSGNIDIYLAFILKTIKLLKKRNGTLISINPNSFLYNKSCKKFREYLISNQFIDEIIDFNSEKIFDDADVYCCIIIINKKKKKFLKYNNEKIYYKNIKSSFFENINNNKNVDTLEKHIEISNGVATLRDKIFIHKNKLYDEPCWRKIYKVSRNITNWIICPYDNKAKIIDEKTFETENPKTYNFLSENKVELAKRDKGNKTYEKWYVYGRSQGLKILKENGNSNFLYISTMCDKNLQIYEKLPMLYYSGLAIKLKSQSSKTLEDIKKTIYNNIDNIYKISSKRGNGWFNLSSSSIKNLKV